MELGPISWYFLLIKVLIPKKQSLSLDSLSSILYMVLWLNVWNKELFTLRNFFGVTKKFLKVKFDCNIYTCDPYLWHLIVCKYLLMVTLEFDNSKEYECKRPYFWESYNSLLIHKNIQRLKTYLSNSYKTFNICTVC